MEAALADTTLGGFAREQLAIRLARVAEQWLRCSEESSAAAIHDLRVSIRRFGEPLGVFKNLFPKQARKQVTAELRQVMKLAGRTRDVDIVRNCFVYADVPLSSQISLFLANERATAEAGLRAGLSVGLATRFASRWEQALALREATAAPLSEDSYPVIARHQKSLWQEHERLALSARSALPGLLGEYCGKGNSFGSRKVRQKCLHQLRLNGKHLRYALEIFRPVYGRRMDELLATLKETQSQLGDITDGAATLRWLKSHELQQTPEVQQLKLFLDLQSDKLCARFADYWMEHWGQSAFEDRWAAYLRRYAGQMPPQRTKLPHPTAAEQVSEAS
jgi:CHAD domain-containing protein